MKRNRHSLYLTGILLTCSLALTACHSTSQTNQSQDSKSYQKTTKTKKPRHKKLSKKGMRKDISGIDKPTDDGFLLTDESQIESKTDTGIIVKHGDHKHFFFYSDLKGTKWDYLIPKDYKGHVSPKAINAGHNNSQGFLGQTEDGYVFNPSDIVSEDANGYTVRHGDHYHYILKSTLGTSTLRQISRNSYSIPSVPPVIHQKGGGVSGIDFRTSDGFLFDGTNISGVTSTGILVKHGNHLHPISFDVLQQSKWSYLVNQYKNQSKDEHTSTLTQEEADFQVKRAYLAKELHVEISQIKKVVNEGKVGLEYPHGDHTHVVFLSELDINKPFESPEDHIMRQEAGESIEQRKERLIKEYMERFKVKREDITIDGNYMSVRHGDHAHVYKIDPNLPDDPERDVKTETTNLDVEQQLVYGPFYTEGSAESLTRKGVYQKYNPKGIQNIKNFVLLTFSTNSDYGNLLVDGHKTKRVYYLVRKDLNWEDLNIQRPDAVKDEGRVFKGWTSELPTSGKMEREHRSFYVDFDRNKKQPTKNVYGPEDDVSEIDLEGYVPIKYTVLQNGSVKLGDVTQGGFSYYVKPGLTWKEAWENGLKEPTPIPNDNYEFIEWRHISFDGRNADDKVSTTISMAAFGTTNLKIGPYFAKNPDNPTDIHDPSRHPNYFWHDPKNYVAIAFKAGNGGELVSPIGRGKSLVYLIRKGTSLSEAKVLPPSTQPQKGYRQDYSHIIVSDDDYHAPVTEDKVYNILFKNIADDNDTDDTNASDSWLDEFLSPSSTSDETVVEPGEERAPEALNSDKDEVESPEVDHSVANPMPYEGN